MKRILKNTSALRGEDLAGNAGGYRIVFQKNYFSHYPFA
jgi:hypothetical protein